MTIWVERGLASAFTSSRALITMLHDGHIQTRVPTDSRNYCGLIVLHTFDPNWPNKGSNKNVCIHIFLHIAQHSRNLSIRPSISPHASHREGCKSSHASNLPRSARFLPFMPLMPLMQFMHSRQRSSFHSNLLSPSFLDQTALLETTRLLTCFSSIAKIVRYMPRLGIRACRTHYALHYREPP